MVIAVAEGLVIIGTVVVPVSVGEADNTLLPEPVLVVTPVPPLATANVPAIVMVPDPVIGPPLYVRPVVPPLTLTLVTVPVPVTVVQVGAPAPPDVSTWPDVPVAEYASAVPVPYGIVPALGVAVLFVPPFAVPSVPVRVIVPDVVTGPPLAVRPVVPPLTLTLVTVPVPAAVVHVGEPDPPDVSTWPAVPAAV
jgi:hypothetical protein